MLLPRDTSQNLFTISSFPNMSRTLSHVISQRCKSCRQILRSRNPQRNISCKKSTKWHRIDAVWWIVSPNSACSNVFLSFEDKRKHCNFLTEKRKIIRANEWEGFERYDAVNRVWANRIRRMAYVGYEYITGICFEIEHGVFRVHRRLRSDTSAWNDSANEQDYHRS